MILNPGTCKKCGSSLASGEQRHCLRCLADALLHSTTSAEVLNEIDEHPRFGDYELIEEIARGGTGIVFRARQVSLDREVAVKLMREAWFAKEEDVKRFRAESTAAARLRHPNIVSIHEVGQEKGQYYFTMDFIEGMNLAERTQNGPLGVPEAAGLLEKIADAVQHAHDHGVIHRDLKPSNVLVDADGKPFVTDFGLARPFDRDSSLTLTGQVLGTPGYMPPEQASGESGVGPAADIYSLGALLYHLLTGRPPFVGGSTMETLRHVIEYDAVSPQLLNPEIPRDLASVCLKCLHKNPSDRYVSARALAEDLSRFLRREPTLARPTPYYRQLLLWCRRKPAWAGLLVALIGLITLSITALTMQMHHTRQRADQQKQAALMLSGLLQGIGPQLALARSSVEVRRLLDESTARVENEFPADSEVAIELLTTIGRSWMAVGDFERAQRAFSRALKLQEQTSNHAGSAIADTLILIGWSERSAGNVEKSENTLRKALAIARKSKEILPLARALHQLGVTLAQERNHQEAEKVLREALFLNLSAGTGPSVETAAVQCDLAYTCHSLGKITEAEALLEESLRQRRLLLGDFHPDVATTLSEFARVRFTQKRFTEARKVTEEAVKIRETIFGSNHVETIKLEWLYATLVRDEGRLDEAETLIRQLLPRIEQAWGKDHVFTQAVRSGIARLYDYEGRREEALNLWLQLLASDYAPEEVLRGLEGLMAPLVFKPVLAGNSPLAAQWHFTTNTPPKDWQTSSLAEDWPRAPAPFGCRDTSARTFWETDQIFLRTTFGFAQEPHASEVIMVRARHDDGIAIWINGTLIATNSEWSHGNHWLYPVRQELKTSLNVQNILAASVNDRDGGSHANIEVYRTDDPQSPLRLILERISDRLKAEPGEVGWWRARGRAELELGLNREAASDFMKGLNLLERFPK